MHSYNRPRTAIAAASGATALVLAGVSMAGSHSGGSNGRTSHSSVGIAFEEQREGSVPVYFGDLATYATLPFGVSFSGSAGVAAQRGHEYVFVAGIGDLNAHLRMSVRVGGDLEKVSKIFGERGPFKGQELGEVVRVPDNYRKGSIQFSIVSRKVVAD